MSKAQSKQNSRRGVLICGAYGLGNAGDDAILEAIIRQMRALDPEMPISVLTRRTKETAARYGAHAIYTFNVFGFLNEMRKTRLYINGGGSLIQDVTSRRSLWYYLFNIWAAKKLGNSVMMYGCGVGPVGRKWGRRLTKRVLSGSVDVITLREPFSRDELLGLGVAGPEIVLASDPALSIAPAAEDEVRRELEKIGIDPDGRYICFALRRWPGFMKKARCFTDAANYAYEKHGLTPVFLSINHLNDGEAADLAAAGLQIPCHIIRRPMPPELTIGIMKKMSAVVSMRLHGLIFAAGAGVPLVGISYDQKVTAFLEYIGQELFTELDDVDSEKLRGLIDGALASSGEMSALEQSARRLAETEGRNIEHARRLYFGREGEKP